MLILTKTFAFTYSFLWMNKKSFCVSKNYVKTKSKYLEMKDLIVLVFHFKVSFFVCDSTGWDVQCGNSLSHFFRKNCYIVDLTNFFSVRDNFSFFHTAVKRTVWKSWNFSLTLFQQKFRESNGYTKQITKELIWRNIFSMRPKFSFFHTVSGKQPEEWKIPSLLKKISVKLIYYNLFT